MGLWSSWWRKDLFLVHCFFVFILFLFINFYFINPFIIYSLSNFYCSAAEAENISRKMLGHRIVTKQTAASGALCSQMMVCERRYNRRETYLALLLNRSIGGLAVMASPQGTAMFFSHSSQPVLCLRVYLKVRDSLTRLIRLPSTFTRDSLLIVINHLIDLISPLTLTERRRWRGHRGGGARQPECAHHRVGRPPSRPRPRPGAPHRQRDRLLARRPQLCTLVLCYCILHCTIAQT